MNSSSSRRIKRREEGRRRGGRRQKSMWRSRRKRRSIRRVGDSSNLMQVTTIHSFSYSQHYNMSPCAFQQPIYNTSFKTFEMKETEKLTF
jgi:hypothetical protein